MSSRREKEKRIRPRNNPYKRNKFDQSKYLHVKSDSNDIVDVEEIEEQDLNDSEQYEAYEE